MLPAIAEKLPAVSDTAGEFVYLTLITLRHLTARKHFSEYLCLTLMPAAFMASFVTFHYSDIAWCLYLSDTSDVFVCACVTLFVTRCPITWGWLEFEVPGPVFFFLPPLCFHLTQLWMINIM